MKRFIKVPNPIHGGPPIFINATRPRAFLLGKGILYLVKIKKKLFVLSFSHQNCHKKTYFLGKCGKSKNV